MDFDLTDEQRLLKDSVDRLIADRYGFEARRTYAREPDGWSRDVWRQFADLGLLGLPFAEADGGFGGGPTELAIVMAAFGRALVVEPYLATVVLAGGALRHLGSNRQRVARVPAIAAGEQTMALAAAERQSRYDLHDVVTRAECNADGWKLHGSKTLVWHGDTADTLIATARVAGGPRDREGIGAFLVDAPAPGLQRRGYATQDGLRAAEIELDGCNAEPLGEPGEALPALERVRDEACAALACEAVGAMEAAHALTVDYLKTRQQFGRPIGSNQALQHRAVDMFVSLEQARSMSLFASMMAAEADPLERRRAIHAAMVQVGRSGRHVAHEAVQLHGGIGVTSEYAVGHYLKRLAMIERSLGDADTHLAGLAELGGLIAA